MVVIKISHVGFGGGREEVEKMGKGVTLSAEELRPLFFAARTLKALLNTIEL